MSVSGRGWRSFVISIRTDLRTFTNRNYILWEFDAAAGQRVAKSRPIREKLIWFYPGKWFGVRFACSNRATEMASQGAAGLRITLAPGRTDAGQYHQRPSTSARLITKAEGATPTQAVARSRLRPDDRNKRSEGLGRRSAIARRGHHTEQSGRINRAKATTRGRFQHQDLAVVQTARTPAFTCRRTADFGSRGTGQPRASW